MYEMSLISPLFQQIFLVQESDLGLGDGYPKESLSWISWAFPGKCRDLS
jgi:hypothetical protein